MTEEKDLRFHFADGTEVRVNKDQMIQAGGRVRIVGKDKGHERLQDCVCSWMAEPVEVRYDYESVFEFDPQRVQTGASYVRAMVHYINPKCTVHGWLLNPIGYVGKPLPRVSNIAVDAVPLANRPGRVLTEADLDAQELEAGRLMLGLHDDSAEGYEMLVEEGGVVSRQTVSLEVTGNVFDKHPEFGTWRSTEAAGWEICGGRDAVECLMGHDEHEVHPILNVKVGRVKGFTLSRSAGDRQEVLVERAKALWAEFMHEHGDKMKWVIDYARAQTTEERERIKYNARKNSEFFFMPLDDPRGLGHCRSCHHDCRFEAHVTAAGHTYRCEEPTCGHTAGCPGC